MTNNLTIDRDAIAQLIPHAGTMCLLDGVLDWDETSIRCRSQQHRAPGNPLRHGERLGVLCGIEFAAQAMAVHGRLSGAVGEKPRAGYLASLRDIKCHADRLDLLENDLTIEATQVMGDHERVMYSFNVSAGDIPLVSGRATVLLQIAEPA
jgi:predicted hotdog family 3-hydroxylacyl-ACP dehydratase